MEMLTARVKGLKIDGKATDFTNKVVKISINNKIENSDSQVLRKLSNVSSLPIFYQHQTLCFNLIRYGWSPTFGHGVELKNYIYVPGSNTPSQCLDLTVKTGFIYYRCHCHKKCQEKFSCKGLCKKQCECGGVQLPKIINCQKFMICEGHCNDITKYIQISTPEEYDRYLQIPYKFRYKHKYINQDLSINFGKYFKKIMVESTLKFTIVGDQIGIATNGDYPFTPEVLREFIEFSGVKVCSAVFKPDDIQTLEANISHVTDVIKEVIPEIGTIEVNFYIFVSSG